MPNPETFPYKNMSFRMHNGEKITVGEANLKRALQYSGTVNIFFYYYYFILSNIIIIYIKIKCNNEFSMIFI